LRATPRCFGTPPFGDGKQVRVDWTELAFVEHGREARREPLDVDAAAARVLADWYALGADPCQAALAFMRTGWQRSPD
jgi:hypothetical protein